MKPDFRTVRQAATGRWHEIHAYMGVSTDALSTKHTECPGCGGNDRFRYLDNDEGGWICGQGGIATGGDGFQLLVHLGYSKSDALHAVSQYLGIENVTQTPEQRDELAQRRKLVNQHKYESTLKHEMHVLTQYLVPRIAWRINSSNENYRSARPEVSQPPDEHWPREVEAVNTIKYLIDKLYGGAS